MDQLLNDFSPGLFAMQGLILLILIVLMRKFAWKPILDALQDREDNIKNAIESAEEAKKEMARLTADNEKILLEARTERDEILKDAKKASEKMISESKEKATAEGEKLITAAREAIDNEKKAALTEVKNQVAILSIEIAERILRKELSSKDSQKDLVDGLIKEVTLN